MPVSEQISILSILFFCCFGTITRFQRSYATSADTQAEGAPFYFHVTSLIGGIVWIAYLIYYGWTVVWWAPLVALLTNFLSMGIVVMFEQTMIAISVSHLGTILLLVCGACMFYFIP